MCPYRFSRAGLNSDTGVSTLYFVQANGRLELFSTATDARLHVVQGTSELDIPSGCSVESLEVLTQRGWVNISSQGFTLSTVSERTFVEVCLPVGYTHVQFGRLVLCRLHRNHSIQILLKKFSLEK